MDAFENHSQWNAVKEVCAKLKSAGYEALLAGGCVRDLLMGRTPNDFDVATSATPDDVAQLYPNAVMVGKAFGVAIVPFSDFQIEVATFREDLEYKDGRRPEGVKFSTPQADAQRRDFTVNALFYDPQEKKVIDYVGGEADIKKRLLRTVGEPDARFNEDKLRLLRAVRFAAQLDFLIDEKTLDAVSRRANEVSIVSHERIRDELVKLFKAGEGFVRGIELLISTGLLAGAFSESAPFILGAQGRWIHLLATPQAQERQQLPLPVKLALFFEPVFSKTGEKDFRDRHLKFLKLDNSTIDHIAFIFKHLGDALKPSKMRRGELIQLSFHPAFHELIEFAQILSRAKTASPKFFSDIEFEDEFSQIINAIQNQFPQAPPPLLDGEDLKAQGIKPGPEFGMFLKEAQLLHLEGALNSREEALEWLNRQRADH